MKSGKLGEVNVGADFSKSKNKHQPLHNNFLDQYKMTRSDKYENDFDLQDPRTVIDLEKENIHLKE